MRSLTAAVLSLVTIVGGHILNRRHDKALFFFALFLISALLGLFAHSLIEPLFTLFRIDNLLSPSLQKPLAIISPMLLVVLLGALISFLDARKTVSPPPITASAYIGALLSLLIIATVASYMVPAISFYMTIESGSVQNKDSSDNNSSNIVTADSKSLLGFSADDHFWNTIRYSFNWVDDSGLKPLPNGDAYLVGRATYKQQPASGITLYGVFNDKYISAPVTTDDEGKFSFQLPAGDWTLNRLRTEQWSNKPQGRRFSVTGPVNQKLSKQLYRDGPEYNSAETILTADASQEVNPLLELTIRDRLAITWPAKAKTSATIADDLISWQPMPQAAQYQVQIQKLTREGRSTHFYPVYWKNSSSTSLPLSAIQTTAAEADETFEYSVVVHAFDADGAFLTSSSIWQSKHSFKLIGKQIPSFQDFPQLVDSDDTLITEQDIDQMQRERALIDAAETLAEEAMPGAARKLIDKIETRHLAKRLDRVEGLLLVAEGRCEEARIHFQTASEKWNQDCLPKQYKQRCLRQ